MIYIIDYKNKEITGYSAENSVEFGDHLDSYNVYQIGTDEDGYYIFQESNHDYDRQKMICRCDDLIDAEKTAFIWNFEECVNHEIDVIDSSDDVQNILKNPELKNFRKG